MTPGPERYSDIVNYGDMDPAKLEFMKAALPTGQNINRFSKQDLVVNEILESRGESAYRISVRSNSPLNFNIAHVVEGIGSKNMIAGQVREVDEKLKIADEVKEVLGRSFYRGVGIDNAATILNDLSSSGASPVTFLLFLAAGSSDWFNDLERIRDLARGSTEACELAGCSYGGGESQTLSGMVTEGQVVLGGSGVGLEFPHYNTYPHENNLKPGLRIVTLPCQGLQTNGLSLPRTKVVNEVARDLGLSEERRFEAYGYDIGEGKTFGEALLEPSEIVSPLMNSLVLSENPIPVRYAVHISGHAWKKIMRPMRNDLTYVIEKMPETPRIFTFIQERTGMDPKEMHETFNMGAYYALFVEEQYVDKVMEEAAKLGKTAIDAGHTEAGPKRVVIEPAGVEYREEELGIR